ncbi:MAG: GntR family transcriptional regulator [Pseudomonadota bacterium]
MYLINASSGTPIYRQIIDQVKRLSASGQLSAGDVLPSVRQVAADIAINPMTVSKAYGQLEHDGVVVRKRGIGMVVNVATETANRAPLLAPAIAALVQEAKQLGMTEIEVAEALATEWENSQ